MKYPLYNDELCPDIWDKKDEEYVMKADVQERLMQIVEDFINEYLAEAELSLRIQDVILIGSGTNYNWTPYSDLDLHVVVDYDELDMDEKYAGIMLTAIKTNWNKSHEIKVKGHDVELYVQNVNEEPESVSVYSVQDKVWLKKPVRKTIKFDKPLIKKKYTLLKGEIEKAINSKDDDELRIILAKLYKFRQAGLDKKGEFSTENLVFKILRAQGLLDVMKSYSAKIYDEEMTLHETRNKV